MTCTHAKAETQRLRDCFALLDVSKAPDFCMDALTYHTCPPVSWSRILRRRLPTHPIPLTIDE